MRKMSLFVFLVLTIGMAACASGPSVTSMVPNVRTEPYPNLDKTLAVGWVSGGKETNPMLVSKIDNESFREALIETLKVSGLFGKVLLEGNGEDFRLDAKLLSQEVKSGVNMAATLLVRYELFRKDVETAVWAENIFSQYEAVFEETFWGTQRAQMANEGAARDNLSQLVEKLSRFLGNNPAKRN